MTKDFESWFRSFPAQYEPFKPNSPAPGVKYFRFAEIDHTRAQKEQRTVEAVLSTESPVARGGYREILKHDAACVDLSRCADGLPLLWSHDPAQQIGAVENIRLHDQKLRGRLRFSESALGEEKWRDVQQGLLKGLSIGYLIEQVEGVHTGERREDLIATRWLPFEASLLTIPADISAGIGRALSMGTLATLPGDMEFLDSQYAIRNFYESCIKPVETLPDISRAVAEIHRQIVAAKTPADLAEARELMVAAWEVARDHPDVEREGSTFIYRNKEKAMNKYQPFFNLKTERGDNPENFSLCRAIALTFDPASAQRGGMEFEIMQDARRLAGKRDQGFTLPENALFRTLSKGGDGAALVGDQHMGGMFVQALRSRLITGRLGCTILPGLVADVTFPRSVSDSTATWISGDGSDDVSESDPDYDNISMSPKTVGAYVKLSRKMLLQGDPASEMLVRDSLSFAVAKALDTAAINGSGSGNQPLGVLNQTGVSTDTYTTAPTFGELVDMEGALMTDDADMGNLGYLTTGLMASVMKKTPIVTAMDNMIWTRTVEGEGRVNGYRALSSNLVPTGYVLFGNWSDLIVGLWSGLDIITDPYTFAKSGSVQVTVLQDVDIAVRHGESFAEIHA